MQKSISSKMTKLSLSANLTLVFASTVALALLTAEVGAYSKQSSKDDRLELNDWNLWYDALFSNRGNVPLFEDRILITIIRLHKGAKQPVDSIKQAIVDFFYEAHLDKPEHCSLDYLDRLKKRCEPMVLIRFQPMMNYCDQLSAKVKRSCYERAGQWIRSTSTLTESEKADVFELSQFRQAGTMSSAGMKMARIVGLEATKTYAIFKFTWRMGACRKVSVISGQLKRDDADLYNMARAIDIEEEKSKNWFSRLSTLEELEQWFSIEDTCQAYEDDKNLQEVYKYARI